MFRKLLGTYRWRIIAMAFVIFAAGVGIGRYWYPGFFIATLVEPAGDASCLQMYPLTDQSLDCSSYDDSAARLRTVNTAINDATALYIQEGKATAISVWVRDLKDKQTASNNETQRYDPASLLKLPLMIAYYKVADIDASLLDTELLYTDTGAITDNTQDIAPSSTLAIGRSYTVEQLLEDMIINSDNNAAAALLAHLDPLIFNSTLLDLGIKIPSSDNSTTHDFVTAKSYSSIFRSLYNASYLTRDYSQKALAIMSRVTFKGIAALLPASVTVSHKFGEREVDNADGSVQVREMHDCGIVYKDMDSYSLCIMTQGNNFTDLQSVIENISKLVYDKI